MKTDAIFVLKTEPSGEIWMKNYTKEVSFLTKRWLSSPMKLLSASRKVQVKYCDPRFAREVPDRDSIDKKSWVP